MARGKSDGTVYIDTRMDTSGIGKGVEDTKRKLTTVSESVRKFGENVKKSFSGAQTGGTRRSYEEVARDIKKAEAQLDRLIEKQIRFVEIGGNRKSQAFAGMEYDIEQARNNLFGLRAELENTEKKAPKSMNLLKKGVDNTTKSIKKMGNASKKAHYSIGKMLATSILFSVVFRAISMVTQGFVDGINNLAKYSEKANTTLSALKSSTTQLKNSFATAFMPIINIVTPALIKLMDVIARINTLIAQFFSALSGNNTYIKAKKVQEDYADSLEGTAAAADKAKGSLSSLDKLNVLTEQKDAGGISAGDMFEEVPIDNKMIELVNRLKNAFGKVAAKVKQFAIIFKDGFIDGIGDVQSRLNTIKNGFDSIKKSLKNIFTSPDVKSSMDRFAKTFAYALGQIVGSVASIGLTIGANIIGGIAEYFAGNEDRIKNHLITMFDIGSDINLMVGEWFDAIAYIFESFASENGIGTTAGLVGIFSEAFMTIQELTGSFGRDIIALLTQPIVDSKDEIKTALDEILHGFDTTISEIKLIIEDWSGFTMQFYNNIISPIIGGITEKLKTLLQKHIAPLFSVAGEFLTEVGILLGNLWNKIFKPFIKWFTTNIYPVIAPILKKVSGSFTNSFEVIADVIKIGMEALTGLIKFVNDVFAIDWKKAWEGIQLEFNKIINKIADTLEYLVNGAIGVINKLIEGINELTSPFGEALSIPTISEVQIPHLATGAVIPPSAPFTAVLGDQRNGRNLEAPEGLIRQIMREELASIGVNVTFEVEGDPNGIFKVTQKKAKEFTKRTGKPAYT